MGWVGGGVYARASELVYDIYVYDRVPIIRQLGVGVGVGMGGRVFMRGQAKV